MKPTLLLPVLLAAALAGPLRAADEFFDRLGDVLTFSAPDARMRARFSGTLELEGYRTQTPAPGLVDTADGTLLERRLTLFLDAQFGPRVYVFAQVRADHGFDPSERETEVRLDEYALRVRPWGRAGLNLQFGRFATVVGNWASRHGAWTNAFVTAPLPYEHLTGIWDTEPIDSLPLLLRWSHVRPGLSAARRAIEKSLRLPIVWGPGYAEGAALSGETGRWRYAAEAKFGSLSSRPEAWRHAREQRHHPTVSARLAYRPSPMWQAGVSASAGSYLRQQAEEELPRGVGRAAYRQTVVAGDVAVAWHHWQLWAEVYASRFAIPRVGNADTAAYYVEAKYKFTPQLFGAVRWNQQVFARMGAGAAAVPWGHDVWRVDVAPGYRFTPHTQLKLQYSLQHGDSGARDTTRLLAAQAVVRF
jgi:hypothetical protein